MSPPHPRSESRSPGHGLFGWFRIGPPNLTSPGDPDTTTGALWQTLRGDPWALAALAILAAVTLFEAAWLAFGKTLAPPLADLGQGLRLALVVVALRAGLVRVIHQEERRFWNGLAVAFACQLAAVVLRAVLGAVSGPIAVELTADALLAFSYLALVMAVEQPIERRRGLDAADYGFTLDWSGGAVFVLGLLFYFDVIAFLANRQAYESGLPSAAMVLVLDAYVTVKLAVFGNRAESPRWRLLYSLLMLAMASLFAVRLLAVLELRDVITVPWTAAVDLAWTAPVLLLILAGRLRRHPFPSADSLFDSVRRRDPLPWPRERLVVFALAFPLVHLAFSAAGLLDETSKGVRETFTLAWLLLFGALALVQQRMLEARARSLWMERMRAEEALVKSREMLRLTAERARAEEAMRKSEEKFVKAFRSIPDAMIISTLAEGRILEVNESFQRHFGYRREEVLGRTGVELALWVELEDRAMMVRLLRERGMVRNLELVLTTKAGGRRSTLLSGEVIDLDGETCLLMVLRDVTERKKAEETLREQAALLDKARDAIAVLDLEDRIVYWNKSAERLYGWRAEEILGRKASEELYPRSADLSETHEKVLARGEWVGELVQRTRAGETIRVESSWTLVRNSRGEPISQLMINTDVTEKRRLEDRLRRERRG